MQSVDIEVLQRLRDWRAAGRQSWLVTVARTFGASPRPPGSMLAMRDDGMLVGSVSGGCIEDDLLARRHDFTGPVPSRQRYGVAAEEARKFGLPCGGELEVLIEHAPELADVETLLQRIGAGELCLREVDLATGGWTLRRVEAPTETTLDAVTFRCTHGPRWRMLIIGASEIAVYLAEIAKTLDFRVAVCDPREEYRDTWRVADVQWMEGMPDDAVLAFRADPRTAIVAVSHDPKLDDMALMEALRSPAAYVGAVGSQRTSEERRSRLLTLGVGAGDAERLHGPVGLAIGSRTPPEIAVAIAAELVALRNGIVMRREALPVAGGA